MIESKIYRYMQKIILFNPCCEKKYFEFLLGLELYYVRMNRRDLCPDASSNKYLD